LLEEHAFAHSELPAAAICSCQPATPEPESVAVPATVAVAPPMY
jgi:hypothetical protein